MLLVLILVANLALVVAPGVWMWPFFRQTPFWIAAAWWTQKIALWVVIPSLAVTIALLVKQQSRRRFGWVVLAIVTIVGVSSQMNIAELIFAPVREARIAPIGTLDEILDTDMVLGVSVNGETRAYPIRFMAYHHLVNDNLGGIALMPTY